jgi:excisionase family DNA binding protein
MPPGIYEVKDVMQIMRISRNTAYKLIQQEGVPYMRVGGRYKIPVERFHEWLSGQFAHLQNVPGCGTMQM